MNGEFVLNAGKVECLVITPEGIRLLVHRDQGTGGVGRRGTYKYAPGCEMVSVDWDNIGSRLQSLSNSHIEALEIATRHKTTAAIRKAHSPGVAKYLRQAADSQSDPETNYWVLKGRPQENPWTKMLQPDKVTKWPTKKRPKLLADGDRLFRWSGTPDLHVVVLAEIESADSGVGEAGTQFFKVRSLSGKFSNGPGIEKLRRLPDLANASFLKSGPTARLFRITAPEAEALYKTLLPGGEEVEDIWPDLGRDPEETLQEEPSEGFVGKEGLRRLKWHLRLERNRKIVEEKKRSAGGQLQCWACDFDFKKLYGIGTTASARFTT